MTWWPSRTSIFMNRPPLGWSWMHHKKNYPPINLGQLWKALMCARSAFNPGTLRGWQLTHWHDVFCRRCYQDQRWSNTSTEPLVLFIRSSSGGRRRLSVHCAYLTTLFTAPVWMWQIPSRYQRQTKRCDCTRITTDVFFPSENGNGFKKTPL